VPAPKSADKPGGNQSGDPDDELLLEPLDWKEQLQEWFWEKGCYYTLSGLGHAILVIGLALFTVKMTGHLPKPQFEAVDTELPELEPFKIGDTPIDPTELNKDTLTLEMPAVEAKHFDDSLNFHDQGGGVAADGPQLGGMGGPDLKALADGVHMASLGGLGGSAEHGDHAGVGGAGDGFAGRGEGHRDAMLGAYGGTRASERAVAGALNWLARHQGPSGAWSLGDFSERCKGVKCDGRGYVNSDAAATALGLLPFLAAGQTQASEGIYKPYIDRGIKWMLKNQQADGSLAAGAEQVMYSHGLVTITLCEDFALTKDPKVGAAAQAAIKFIQLAQNRTTGGWRYRPGDDGDTSVVGWQVMGLKSAKMAGLVVDEECFELAKKFLGTVKKSARGGLFAYIPFQEATPSMSAVGLLCEQYLGAPKDDPGMLEGKAYLLANAPAPGMRDIYYWYYGTQVLHNLLGPEWDRWNRQTRRTLIESQIKEGCAAGSWDPALPEPDARGQYGGRIMMTSLSALTLEVYYRYLPLYSLDADKSKSAGAKAAPMQFGK
jgi:hypothetical protein